MLRNRLNPACLHIMFLMLLQDGSTALMFASLEGHTAAVQVLLADSKVEVNVQRKVSTSSWWLACADADVQNGWTALMFATSLGRTATVEALLADRRVDVNIKDKDGRAALDLAKKQEIKVMLLAKESVCGIRLWDSASITTNANCGQ